MQFLVAAGDFNVNINSETEECETNQLPSNCISIVKMTNNIQIVLETIYMLSGQNNIQQEANLRKQKSGDVLLGFAS